MVRLPLIPRWVRLAVVLFVLILITMYSIVPVPGTSMRFGPFGVLRISQYAHLLSYAGLAMVLGYALVDSPRPDWQVFSVILAFSIGFGISMELLQSAVPHRRSSLGDIVVNAIGTTLALTVWRGIQRRARFRRID